ncbi:MAG: hypothetical protein PHC50_05025 [Candidatus Cloacimonetes bacterium]|nr:hypothetical protein [Candidatus Cloacimonadota bacterium]
MPDSYTTPDALMIEIYRAIYGALESRLYLIGSVVDADVRMGTLNTIPTVSTELRRRTPMILHRMLSEAWKCHPVSPTIFVLHPLF